MTIIGTIQAFDQHRGTIQKRLAELKTCDMIRAGDYCVMTKNGVRRTVSGKDRYSDAIAIIDAPSGGLGRFSISEYDAILIADGAVIDRTYINDD